MRQRLFFIVFIYALLLESPAYRGQNQSPPRRDAPDTPAADIEAAVATICAPTDILRLESGGVSGCHGCPEGTDFRGTIIGDRWDFAKATFGHFTSAHDESLILSGFGCDSHASNDGGSFVFSMTSGKPHLLNYDKGLITDECQKFHEGDGTDFLVCREEWSGQGEDDLSVFLAQFDDTGDVKQTYFFQTQDTSGTCPDDASPQQKVQDSDIRSIKYETKGPGELRGVTIIATQGKITCAQANAEIDEEPDVIGERPPRKEFPSVKTYEIHFLFDGKKLVVAPESKAAFGIFRKFH
jgi:hypothetical protein